MPYQYNHQHHNLCSKHREQKFEIHAFRYNNIVLFFSLLFAGFTILSVLWHVSNKKEGDNVVLHLLAVAVCVCIIQIAFVSHAFLDLNNFFYNIIKTPLFQNILRRIGISVENFGVGSFSSVIPAPVSVSLPVSSPASSVQPVSLSSLTKLAAPVSNAITAAVPLSSIGGMQKYVSDDVLNQYKLLDSYVAPVKQFYNTYNSSMNETSLMKIYQKLSPYITKSADLESLYQNYLQNPNATNGAALTSNDSSVTDLLNQVTPLTNSFSNIVKTIGPIFL